MYKNIELFNTIVNNELNQYIKENGKDICYGNAQTIIQFKNDITEIVFDLDCAETSNKEVFKPFFKVYVPEFDELKKIGEYKEHMTFKEAYNDYLERVVLVNELI